MPTGLDDYTLMIKLLVFMDFMTRKMMKTGFMEKSLIEKIKR